LVAEKVSSQTIHFWERSFSEGRIEERLPKWLLLSLIFHGLFIAVLFIAPLLPRSRPEAPVYVVDLVGGEKIGGMKIGTEIAPPPTKAKEAEPAPAAPPPPKVESKKEAPEKSKPVEKKAPEEKKTTIKEKTKAEPVKSEPALAKKEPPKETKAEKAETKSSESASADSVRERLLQAALERAKARAENPQKQALSTGPGEGEGAAGPGVGGRGGPGVVRGMDFIIYQNRMLGTIKDNWTWVGQRSNLKVVVHFGIKDSGEIVGLKIVQPSGDPSYDESVLRAVKKSSPLPAPPESYRKDFADVELTFRPRDLGA
jgi:colicin import membrane protein